MCDNPCVFALNLSYDGALFHGFAKQKDSSLRTVQGCLEQALKTIFRREVVTVCAGRTDSGVHARDQYISFELTLEEKLQVKNNPYKFIVSMNALTQEDICVKNIFEAPDNFSARFNVDMREYRYRICVGAVPPMFLRRYSWWHKASLDIVSMQKAAQYLVGEHDFKSFCKLASAIDKSTIRCIHSIEIFKEEHLGEECIVIKIIGNAFLHSMVRTIVGTLAMVGTKQRSIEWVKDVLESKDRNKAGSTAPAAGLTFWKVTYPQGLLNLL